MLHRTSHKSIKYLSHVRGSYLREVVTRYRGKLLLKTAFSALGSDRYNAQSVMRYAPFVSRRGHAGTNAPENSVDGEKNTAQRIAFARALDTLLFFARRKKEGSNSYIISRPVKIIYLQPPGSPSRPRFLSFRAPALPLAPLLGKTRGGILVHITHHPLPPLCHIRSINSRLEPLGATNKTVKPFN